jgi:formylglycine-generating enzyme required for sulfatase activity
VDLPHEPESSHQDIAMTDVFISYARKDLEKVRPLVEAIEGAGYDVFWDRETPAGMTRRQYVGKALDEARCIIVVWSASSIGSYWVIEEADDGRRRGILIPITIEDVKPPPGFRALPHEDLGVWDSDPEHPLIKRLLAFIDGSRDIPVAHAGKTANDIPKSFTNQIGMTFVLVPAGTSTMGSDESTSANPMRRVIIRKPFYLQTTEVTQAQWMKVMGENPSCFRSCGDNCPVEMINWKDVQTFIHQLNALTDDSYRLPSEAEWEYAARSGGRNQTYAGGEHLDELGWYRENSGGRTHPAGQKKPNGLGLYDMNGNVWEWVEDDWHFNYEGAPEDGRAWVDDPRASGRVIRGGSWNFGAGFCRATTRVYIEPGYRLNDLGIRLARSLTPDP